MDKYEYNLKLDQMKTFLADENYEEAANIADSINWNKIKNVNALVKAGEVYEKAERYEDSKEVLLLAYDRSPIGRMIIYKLAEVAIKMGDFTAAEEYYEEFVKIAPHDNLRYVLRYNIKKNQGASYDELIPILEELKEQEYTEEWAYELAYLYHKNGDVDKCIDACDELILWFGDGPYVERALELKMCYQPLTKIQEEKYRKFRLEKEGYTEISAEEMERAGETVHAPVMIPKVDVNTEKFNTVNLQEEIAKGMQQIIAATEKETVSDTMDNIKKIVEDIPYLQIPREEEKKQQETSHIETDEEIDGSLKINFQEMLGEESDGQISLVMDEKAQLEKQITGQMTIQDILEEWEKTRRAAEAALEEAKQRKLESAKARALIEAGDIMDRLNDVIPKLDAGVSPKELLEEEYLQGQDKEEIPILRNIVPKKVVADDVGIPNQEISEEMAVPIPEADLSNASAIDMSGAVNVMPAMGMSGEIDAVPDMDMSGEIDAVPAMDMSSEINAVPDMDMSGEIDAAEIDMLSAQELGVSDMDIADDVNMSEDIAAMDEIEVPEVEIPDDIAMPDGIEASDMTEISDDISVSADIEIPEDVQESESVEVPEDMQMPESVEAPEDMQMPESVEAPEDMQMPESVEAPEDMKVPEVNISEIDISANDSLENFEVPKIDLSGIDLSFGNMENTVDNQKSTIPETNIPSEDNIKEDKISMAETKRMPVIKQVPRFSEHKQATSRMPEIKIPDISMPEDLDKSDEEPEIPVLEELTEEQKAVFSYFVPVKGMEDQLCKAISSLSAKLANKGSVGTGNLIIQGEQGCGKTVLATSLIKVLQMDGGYPKGKIGKIDAAALNNKDAQQMLKKVAGGCLIIEKAGDINRNTAVSLALLMAHDTNGTIIILEDTSKGIKKALTQDEGFAKLFSDKISVPIFTNDELVSFARSYSNELGYEIDEMAVLALYNRISNIQRLDQAATLTEVKEIVDEAIEREAHGGLKKAISILTAKRYTEDDKIVLTERNFEEI